MDSDRFPIHDNDGLTLEEYNPDRHGRFIDVGGRVWQGDEDLVEIASAPQPTTGVTEELPLSPPIEEPEQKKPGRFSRRRFLQILGGGAAFAAGYQANKDQEPPHPRIYKVTEDDLELTETELYVKIFEDTFGTGYPEDYIMSYMEHGDIVNTTARDESEDENQSGIRRTWDLEAGDILELHLPHNWRG